jgi:hypothetical protein
VSTAMGRASAPLPTSIVLWSISVICVWAHGRGGEALL